MEVDQLGSELSMKFAIPIRDGERSLFLPSLRVGWAADWGMSGDHQKVSYLKSGKSQRWDVNGNDDNAALVELGLDLHHLQLQRHLDGGVCPWWSADLGW